MAQTRPTSKTVGPRLKTSALRTKEMPRVPRSIALDSAPVCRLRWNPRSRLCRWRKTFLAMRRMELWATLPNTVFLSSLNNAVQARDPPSGMNRGDEDLNSCCEKQGGSDKEAPQQRRGNILYPHPQQLRTALKPENGVRQQKNTTFVVLWYVIQCWQLVDAATRRFIWGGNILHIISALRVVWGNSLWNSKAGGSLTTGQHTADTAKRGHLNVQVWAEY